MLRTLLFVVLATVFLATLASLNAQPPDIILVNGKILTLDPNDTTAQAIAIRGNIILRTGATDEIRKLASPQTRIVDLHGRTATPGLIDTHCHFQEAAKLYDAVLDSPDIHSIADALAIIKARVAQTPKGEWIRGSGWDEGKFAEKRYLTAADLDRVSPDNPVYLVHSTGHYGVANSAAMRLAHVTRDTQPPPSGTIDRDASGNPTGVLKESAAGLVSCIVPPFTKDQRRAGLLKIIADFNQEGMTGVKSMSIAQADWDLYIDALSQNKLTVRLCTLWNGGRNLESARRVRDRILSLPRAPQTIGGILMSGGVKFYMDGSGGGRTAWMYEPFNKDYTGIDAGNVGYPTTEPETYSAAVKLFNQAGIHIGTHAMGDRAIDYVVDAYAAALKENPIKGLRHAIIHANTPTDHAIAAFATLQRDYDAGYPEIQAPFIWWLGDNYAGNLGPKRAPRLLPLKTFVDKGILFTGGSDFFVTPFPARYGLWASVERKTLLSRYGATPFGTGESIDIHTALRSYTIWAARQIFMEDRIGSLEPGKQADIAIWDRDPYTVPAAQLKEMKCVMTLFAGRVVYEAGEVGA